MNLKTKLEIIVSKFTTNDISIDCGANVGQITEMLSTNGATVYAFEPNAVAFKFLSERFKRRKNVICINKGVWDRNMRGKLYSHKDSDKDELFCSTGSSICEDKANVSRDKFEEIDIIDLTEFVKKLNKRIRVLKIDIEGAECEVIEKLIHTQLYKNADYIFVETHEKKIPGLMDKLSMVKSLIRDRGIKNIDLNWR